MIRSIQILLFSGSLISLIYTVMRIRKSDVRIMDMFSWIVLSITLVLMSIFPQVIMRLALLFGFEASVNFIFLVIIFYLLFRCFSLSIQLSHEKEKMRSAIEEMTIRLQELEERSETR